MSDNQIPTKEIAELLDTVSEKMPRMIKELLKSLYSQEAGSQMGKGVGAFYKELIQAGIPQEDALRMTQDYLNTVKSLATSNFGPPGGHGSNSKGEKENFKWE